MASSDLLNPRAQLIAILQLAYSGELAAAYAYRGHWHSVSDPEERRQIKKIEDEEWHHRRQVGEMLASLDAGPNRVREVRATIIGRCLGLMCHLSGWFAPMYGAGRLESRNIVEYETAARHVRGIFMKTLLLLLLLPLTVHPQPPNKQLAAEVKAEFLHAWNGYKKYAWGHDDLKPLSKTHHDWYPHPLLMTAVDSLDTMILMDLDEEAAATKEYILNNLSFDKDIEVQNFEITIRLLGGLLTNYQLIGDKRFLNLAEDLGNRLLPVFNSPTGLPYRYVNLKTGKVSKAISNPAETGTLIVEFGTLSKLTGKPVFYEKAKRALV